jgi:hypothetical protein
MTVAGTAKLLRIHRNIVHTRIKPWRIRTHKVVEGECEVYPIEWSRSALGADVRALVAQADREVMARCRNVVSSCSKSYAQQSRHETC